MNEKTLGSYRLEDHPEAIEHWMRQGPKTAAFLLVIPGCTTIGLGIGLLASAPVPYSVIGLGMGLLTWGLIVSLSKQREKGAGT